MDDGNSPASVLSLREQLKAADGVLICTPEYAFGIPGSLKNALDWTESSGEFFNKPVAVVSASPSAAGDDKAHAALLLTLKALGANVPEQARLIVPMVYTKLDANGKVSDAATLQALVRALDALAQAIKAGRAG